MTRPTTIASCFWAGRPHRVLRRIKRIELFCRGGGSLVALRAMHAEIPGWSNFAEEVLGGRQPAGSGDAVCWKSSDRKVPGIIP